VSKVSKVSIDTSVLQSGGNFLLIGSDSRAFVDDPQDSAAFGSAQQQTGQRSDTIMVAHIDAKTGTAVAGVFPARPSGSRSRPRSRQDQRRVQLRTAARDRDDRSDFDVPISHYLEVDFQGFRKMVNAIGTIPIYFPTPARDIKTGLAINKAGCQHLNGDQALAYVRSRYYESLVNGNGDRIRPPTSVASNRQQYFLRTLAQQTLHAATAKPWKASSLLDSMLSNIQRDPKLGLSPLRALAYAFHRPVVSRPSPCRSTVSSSTARTRSRSTTPKRRRSWPGCAGRRVAHRPGQGGRPRRSTSRSRTGPARPGSAPAPSRG